MSDQFLNHLPCQFLLRILYSRTCTESELIREHMLEKEQLAAAYQEQVAAMETEITILKERAQYCRKVFREKIDKVSKFLIICRVFLNISLFMLRNTIVNYR